MCTIVDVAAYDSKVITDSDRSKKTRAIQKRQKHTTGGIPRWSPTLVLVARFSAYVWQSGRDAQFSLTYGRMCLLAEKHRMCSFGIEA
jgi:hypothetical protein